MESITPQQLSEKLELRFPNRQETGPESLGNEELVARLGKLEGGGEENLSLPEQLQDPTGEKGLTPQQVARLAWVDEAFKILFRDYEMDEALTTRIRGLIPLVAAVAVADDRFLEVGNHPVQRFVDAIYGASIGWHGNLGRAGETLITRIDDTTQELRAYLGDQSVDQETPLKGFVEFLREEKESADKTRERVSEREKGQLKAAGSRLTAARALNELMHGHQFPSALTELMQGPWYDSLQLILMLHGEQSDEWSRAAQLTETLIRTVQPYDRSDDDHRQRLYKIIPRIPKELRQLLLSLENDPEGIDEALAAVEEVHFMLLRNKAPQFSDFEEIDLGSPSARARATKQMLKQLEELEIGQWFLVKRDDEPSIRAQMALKLDDVKQMLFVNRVGARVMHKSYDEFAYLFFNQLALPLREEPALTLCLQRAAGLRDQQVSSASPGDAGLSGAGTSRRTADAEPQEQVEINSPQDLAIGRWVLFTDGGEAELCKLAVRVARKDKYLFVDSRGQRSRELGGEELQALIDAGQLEAKGSGQRFQQAINELVSNIRVSEEEQGDHHE